ncbi:MAG: hypothetical protein KGN79_11950 [Acidobacteriota bacterium]|nr:hypothetical protein [Acidobacteriota bacterium]
MPPPARILALCLLLTAFPTFAQDNDLAPANPEVAVWKQHLADVSAVLGPQLNCDAPKIVDAEQFADQGPSVALVKPCPTGEHADQIKVLILEDGKPIMARFRDPSGKPMTPQLERSKSQLKPRDVQLDARHGEIITTAQDRNEHNQYLGCIAAVFSWNRRTRTFDWNTGKSKKQYISYCAQ